MGLYGHRPGIENNQFQKAILAQPIYDLQVYASALEQRTSRPRPADPKPALARRGLLRTPVAMDYTLAALKIFASQLADSTEAPSSDGSSASQMLFNIRFQRAWVQGVILSANYDETGGGRLLLDDGSCVADLFVSPKEAEGRLWRAGMYVMVIGAYIAPESKENYPAVKVHKIVDLSSEPDREAMWYMEVAEAYNFFYLPFSVAGSPS